MLHICDGRTRREIDVGEYYGTRSAVEYWTLCDRCGQWILSGIYLFEHAEDSPRRRVYWPVTHEGASTRK